MRKTSQDRTDSTSVTSGLDNELKKPGTSNTKIKKSSIKRKVKNFSHDSDDAIIEPLLQTEKENPVDADKSAKYLLNKSKTDCVYEEDTKTLETPKVSLPVSTSHNVTNNIISERQASPSIVSETAPTYHHVNINVFSGNEQRSFNNSFFVEIDGSKAIGEDITPLIFTTAKIHTDTKKKLMEQFQVKPMPISSTIEGNPVKSGVIYEDNKRHSISHTNKNDISKNMGHKSDLKIEPAKFNDSSHVKMLTTENLSSATQIRNEEKVKKESDDQDPFEKSAKLFSKDQKVSLKTSIANSIGTKLPTAKVTSDGTVTTPSKPITAAATCKANGGFMSDTSTKVIGTEPKSITLDNNNIINKSKGVNDNEKINLSKLSQPCPSSSKQNNKSNTNTTQSDKIDSIKSFSTSSKKLQRQKNASTEEIKAINYKELNNSTTDKNSPLSNKIISTAPDLKSQNTTIYQPSTPITTVATKGFTPIVSSGLQSKSLISSTTNPSTCKASVITGTSALINSNPVTETVKTKSAPTKIPEPSRNITPATSSKTNITSTAKSTKVTDDRSSAKQDIKSFSNLPSKINKTESTSTTTSSTASNLPLYIVSTSKTKIGSSSTPTISTVTKKSLDQKPISEVANGKSGKPLMSTSLSQTKQSSSKPNTTNVNLVKKDDRA